MSPRSERKAAASAGSSCAISSSIFAHTADAAVPARERNGVRPAVSAARSICAAASPPADRSASSRLITMSSGLADRNWNPRSRLRSSPFRSSERSGRPSSSAALQSIRTSRSRSRSADRFFLRSFSRRSSRRSATPRSARISSSSIACASCAGSMDPEGCGTAGSRNARSTWTSASAFLYATTSTSAFAPPAAAVAARSVNSTVAGTRLRGLYIAVRRSSRASGTFEMPTEVSPLPCAPRAVSRALVMS